MFGAVKGLIAFFASPIAGVVSDRIGRKWVLLVSACGTVLPLTTLLFTKNMYVFQSLDCLAGVVNATQAVAYAYIADTIIGDRAKGFGYANAAFGASFLLGPLTGAMIAKTAGWNAVFTAVTVLMVINGIYISAFLPESIALRQSISSIKSSDLNPCRALRILWTDRVFVKYGLVAFSYCMLFSGVSSTLLVYLSARFDFQPFDNAVFLTAFGLLEMLSSAVLVKVMVPRFGENRCLLIGMAFQTLATIGFGLVASKVGLYLCLVFLVFAPLTFPALCSLVSNSVALSEQGQVQGAISGVKALCAGIAPAVFGSVLRATQRTDLPGAAYIICSVFGVFGVGVILTLPPQTARPNRDGSVIYALVDHNSDASVSGGSQHGEGEDSAMAGQDPANGAHCTTDSDSEVSGHSDRKSRQDWAART